MLALPKGYVEMASYGNGIGRTNLWVLGLFQISQRFIVLGFQGPHLSEEEENAALPVESQGSRDLDAQSPCT